MLFALRFSGDLQPCADPPAYSNSVLDVRSAGGSGSGRPKKVVLNAPVVVQRTASYITSQLQTCILCGAGL